MAEAKLKNVELELRQGEDGHWLSFKTKNGQQATINIENTFNGNIMVHKTIRRWASEQFTRSAERQKSGKDVD